MLPSPSELGLPAKFTRWRPQQAAAVEVCEDSEKRFIAQAAPTGFGKSLTYMANALLTGGRTAILTSTKGLQSQLITDFREAGLVDIRGMANYACLAAQHYGLSSRTNCAEGPCHWGAACSLKRGGCLYYDAYRTALESQVVVTNYSYWMHSYRYSESGLGKFEFLILDEAHDAPESVSAFISVTIDSAELGWLLDDGRTPDTSDALDVWREWAADKLAQCKSRSQELTARIESAAARGMPLPSGAIQRGSRLKALQRHLDTISTMRGEWAIERQPKGRVNLEPIWPAPYVENTLFRGIAKIALFSATIRPKTLSLLGIKPGTFEFHEYASDFPIERRPTYYVPTVAVKYSSTDGDLRIWLDRIDQILRQRLDRKTIIHCTSYARRDLIVHNSEFRRYMLWHGSDDTASVVERYRRAKPPAILVSPSVTTGWDFPYTECECQIIAKIPFPDFTSAVAVARDKSDPDWSRYLAMLTLVQTTGRAMRAADDQCENIIIDDNAEWFVRKYSEFAPTWWRQAYQTSRTLPIPPIKLLGE